MQHCCAVLKRLMVTKHAIRCWCWLNLRLSLHHYCLPLCPRQLTNIDRSSDGVEDDVEDGVEDDVEDNVEDDVEDDAQDQDQDQDQAGVEEDGLSFSDEPTDNAGAPPSPASDTDADASEVRFLCGYKLQFDAYHSTCTATRLTMYEPETISSERLPVDTMVYAESLVLNPATIGLWGETRCMYEYSQGIVSDGTTRVILDCGKRRSYAARETRVASTHKWVHVDKSWGVVVPIRDSKYKTWARVNRG